ncbi:MAG: PA14 domain-containing protein [Opitutaceae bacterium]
MSTPSLASVDLSSSANFTTGFEAEEGYTSGFLSSDSSWILENGSTPEVGSFAFSGQFGLALDGYDTIRLDFSSFETPSVGWVDLYLKPAFGESDGLPIAFPLGQAALTGFVEVGLDGEIFVLHGNGSGDGVWMPSGYTVALDGNVSMDWLRMTYRLDYDAQRWDLYLDNALQIIDVGFIDASAPPLSKFSLEGSLEGATHFDQFTAGFINPLFADADNDGIDDAYETAQGMDPLANDRDRDLDSDTILNVMEFMDGLDAGNPDTDGDGVHDGAEISAGANPASADAYALETVPYIESFEVYSEGDVTAQSFWEVAGGNAIVQSAERFDGAQALELQVGETTLELQNAFDGSDHAQVWVDFHVQPVHFQDRWLTDIDDYLSAEFTTAFFFIENEQIAILDGDGQGSGSWTLLGDIATDSEAWTRVTIHQDYTAQEFKLWVDGALLDGSYGFANTQPYFNRLSIKQDNTQSAYLDDVYVSAQRPLGLDSDGDGLTDDTEDANGNGLVDPGESDPFLTDTDGDGFPDSDPAKLRLWLLAGEGIQADSNGQLSTWLDQSIYQDHATPASSLTAPTLVEGRVNFDGVDDYVSGASNFDANAGDLTVVVVQRNTNSADAAPFSYLNSELSSGSPLLTWSASDFFGFTGPEGNPGLLHDLSGATSELTITALRRSGGEANGLNSALNLRSSSDLISKESTSTQTWESVVYQYDNEFAAIIQEGPSLNNGSIDGSLQVCLPGNFTINGATINGDLLVAGDPEVRVNGNPDWDGVVTGDGTAADDYRVTLNSNATLGALKTLSNAVEFPTLEPVATPQGSRYVSLNSNSNDPGDFASIRNLTLNGNLGAITVPAGAYGNFTANGNNTFVFGDPNSEAPLVYEFERLTLNGNASLTVLGPIIIRVKNNLSLNADLGDATTVDILTLELPTANLTLNSNSSVYGTVIAPEGKVTLNSNSTLTGRLIAEELTLNGGDLVAAGTWPTNSNPELGYLIGKTSPQAATTYAGEILEIRVYDQALEDDVLDVIQTQLAEKYGIDEDFDNDGITNFNDPDIDGDGLLNLEEDLNANGVVDAGESDPYSTDSDGDGILDTYDLQWIADPVTDAATLQAQPDGSLKTRFSFDAADGYATGSLGGQQGWEAAPVFRVSADDAVDGTDQSLSTRPVAYDSETETAANAFAAARHYLDTSAASTIWVSFQAKLQPAILADIDLSSNPAVALTLSSQNSVSVYDSSQGDWLKARDVASPDTWTSYAIELDYANKVWKLCVAGQTVFETIPFVDPNHSSLEQFIFLQQSGLGDASWIDEIEISDTEPAGLDFDGDGLDNATERQLGSDLNSTDTDDDGIDDLYEASNGLDLLFNDADQDLDGDGLLNFQEYALGLDPQVNDIEGADGLVRRDVWQNIVGESLTVLTDSSNYPTNPDLQLLSLDLDIQDADSLGDNYGQRIYGLIVAPESTEYTFWIAGDDAAEFWLSTDATAFNKSRLCYSDVPTSYQEWDRNATQQSIAVLLEAGQAYYFEILQKENDGASHVSIAWESSAQSREIITSEHLRMYLPGADDADQDGLSDAWELANGLDPTKGYGVNGSAGDPNEDGRLNVQHQQLGTDPSSQDTDGDGMSNQQENALGFNPLIQDVAGPDGVVSRDVWTGISGQSINSLTDNSNYPTAPNLQFSSPDLDLSVANSIGNNYGQRIYGLIVAPETAEYIFWISGDDYAEFWLSTDATAFRKSRLCYLDVYSDYQNWNQDPTQQSVQVQLEAGQAYYFEVLHKNNGGEGHVSVAWQYALKTRSTISSEYLRMHSPDPGDADQDGLLDDWELANGLDPTKGYGIDGYAGDYDGDGLLNHQEHQYGTNPTSGDSDGDGFGDAEELYGSLTDPLIQNLHSWNPVSTIDLADATPVLGSWSFNQYDELSINDIAGKLDVPVSIAQPGLYKLQVPVRYVYSGKLNGSRALVIHHYIDGEFVKTSEYAQTTSNETELLEIFLPYLETGEHTYQLHWENVYEERVISLADIELSTPGGISSDQLLQLQQEFVGATESVQSTNVQSAVSPAFVEGDSRYLSMMALSDGSHVFRAPGDAWYADIDLPSDASVLPLNVDFQNHGLSIPMTLQWVSTDVLAGGQINVRTGDSLRLTAGEAPDGTSVTISIDGVSYEIVDTEPLVYEFTEPGEVTINATRGGISGMRSVIVHPRTATADAPAMTRGYLREWTWSGLGDLTVDAGDVYLASISSTEMDSTFFIIRNEVVRARVLAARIGEGGPIVQTIDTDGFWARENVEGTYDSEFIGEGVYEGVSQLICSPLPDDVSLVIDIFNAGVMFEDGTVTRTITNADLDEFGRYELVMLKPEGTGGSICHHVNIYENGEFIHRR